MAMDRRDVEDRRKIARFTAKPVNENLKILIKLSRFQMIFFITVAIYLMLMLIFIGGQPMLALFVLGGGPLIFGAFRLHDLIDKSNLYLQNESVTNMERTTHSIVLIFLLYTFIFVFGAVALCLINWDLVTLPLTSLF